MAFELVKRFAKLRKFNINERKLVEEDLVGFTFFKLYRVKKFMRGVVLVVEG